MISQLYRKRLLLDGGTVGAARKHVSDIIMNHTWDNDIQSRKCYIYDFFHDDEHEKYSGLTPDKYAAKYEVDAKFIVSQYTTLSKDQVEYHIMFRPGFKNPLNYFQTEYADRFKSEFPIGLYIDIPNDEGIYYRWMICSKEIGNQFVKYLVLPCNYKFQWIFDHQRYEMWGVARLRNSYNSGIWEEYRTSTVENQDAIWLPLNTYSMNLYYNQRIIVSHPIYYPQKEIFPITWMISKVEGLHPFGIQKLILFQDKFDKNSDYIEMDENGNITGMWADYFSSNIEPLPDKTEDNTSADYSVITCSGYAPKLKVGGGYKTLTCKFYDQFNEPSNHTVGEWTFTIDGESVKDDLVLLQTNDLNSIKIKCSNQDYIGKIIVASAKDTDGKCYSEIQIELISL